MLPMLGFMGSFSSPDAALSEPLDLYIHGYVSSRLMKLGTNPSSGLEGFPLTMAATHVDGLVLALTPNHHSYNYRSAILHGYAIPVTDMDEKLWAMQHITNNVVEDRWANTRLPPTKTEMTSTQILKVSVVDASAKIRAGSTGDDRADLKNEELRAKVWTGVVPTWTMLGTPVPSPDNRVAKVRLAPGDAHESCANVKSRFRSMLLALLRNKMKWVRRMLFWLRKGLRSRKCCCNGFRKKKKEKNELKEGYSRQYNQLYENHFSAAILILIFDFSTLSHLPRLSMFLLSIRLPCQTNV